MKILALLDNLCSKIFFKKKSNLNVWFLLFAGLSINLKCYHTKSSDGTYLVENISVEVQEKASSACCCQVGVLVYIM